MKQAVTLVRVWADMKEMAPNVKVIHFFVNVIHVRSRKITPPCSIRENVERNKYMSTFRMLCRCEICFWSLEGFPKYFVVDDLKRICRLVLFYFRYRYIFRNISDK